MSALLAVLGFFKALLGFAEERERSGQLEQARQGGAAEAAQKGSKEVDELVLEAEEARDNVDDSEEAILKDPDNRGAG